ncbi:MAG: phosphoribosylanthranilate isomerase [Chloroflexi bacterium]|nr:phosphoribosylanthranilate isomerase [Chloroflexota bacterium]
MTKIKICGITDIAHASAAAEARVDFIGIVLSPSRRQLSPEKARHIILTFKRIIPSPKERPAVVGVFANEPPERVNELVDFCGLDWVQLSGEEDLDYCNKIKRPIIKTLHVKADQPLKEILPRLEKFLDIYRSRGYLCHLDSSAEGAYGGTGQTFDWGVAQELAKVHSFLLAGGLTPENVGRAVEVVQPWGVDVSSGVETQGLKDINKIATFIRAVKTAEKPRRLGRLFSLWRKRG